MRSNALTFGTIALLTACLALAPACTSEDASSEVPGGTVAGDLETAIRTQRELSAAAVARIVAGDDPSVSCATSS